MNIVAIIPARYASTRFPGKPLANINGKTMIQRVYEQAKKAIPLVCVATDDKRIEDAVIKFGGNVVMTADTHVSGTDRCAEAVIKFEKSNGIMADVVINIQGDEPFIDPIQILQLTDLFKNKNTEIATLIKKVANPDTLNDKNIVKVVKGKTNDALYFSRSPIPHVRGVEKEQWLSKHDFYLHIGMYGYKKNTLLEICNLPKGELESAESLEQLRWLENGIKIKTAVTDIDSFGIDTLSDLEKVLNKFDDINT